MTHVGLAARSWSSAPAPGPPERPQQGLQHLREHSNESRK